MALIDRDHALEHETLERVGRVAQEPWFTAAVTQRLDAVEAAGGPDGGGVGSAAAAFREAYDEAIDLPAWTIVGLTRLGAELAAGDVDLVDAIAARQLLEDAMVHAAHAAHLVRGVVELLN